MIKRCVISPIPIVGSWLLLWAMLHPLSAAARGEQSSPISLTAEHSSGGIYTITIDAASPLHAHVEADLPAGSSKLHMAGWGADQMPRGWASFVSHLAVSDGSHDVAVTADEKAAAWTAASEGPLHLAYDVDLSFANQKWPSGNEQAGFFDGHALFVVSKALFIVAEVPGERTIALHVPSSWTIATPWSADGPQRFRASDINDLLDNSLVVGNYAKHDFRVGTFEVTIALLGAMRSAEPLVTDALQKVLASYGRIFPDAPRSRYLMTLFQSDDIDAEAFAHSAAFTERDPLTRENAIGWCNTLAHELFHSWNGHRIAGRDYATSQWLSEGFTEYFANLTLVQQGLVPERQFLDKAEKNLGLYALFRSSPAFGKVSVADAGKEKGRNRIGVYDGGWTVAFCLDAEIRRATGSSRTLANFMRLLDARFGATGTQYTMNDVIAAASETAGHDLAPFFTRYVTGTDELPLREALHDAGLGVYTQLYDGEVYVWRSGKNRIGWPMTQ